MSGDLSRLRCLECERLLESYRESTIKTVAASRRLADVVAGYETDSFMRAWNEVHKLHLECMEHRERMLLHLKSHATP
jgi:hypothetical protein